MELNAYLFVKAYPSYVDDSLLTVSVELTPLLFTSLDYEFVLLYLIIDIFKCLLMEILKWYPAQWPWTCLLCNAGIANIEWWIKQCCWILRTSRCHGGRVVTLSSPTSEAGVWFTARPQVGKLVVACRWLVVYSTEPWPTVCTGFLCPQNYPSWYDLYSVESNVKPQINKICVHRPFTYTSKQTTCGKIICSKYEVKKIQLGFLSIFHLNIQPINSLKPS